MIAKTLLLAGVMMAIGLLASTLGFEFLGATSGWIGLAILVVAGLQVLGYLRATRDRRVDRVSLFVAPLGAIASLMGVWQMMGTGGAFLGRLLTASLWLVIAATGTVFFIGAIVYLSRPPVDSDT